MKRGIQIEVTRLVSSVVFGVVDDADPALAHLFKNGKFDWDVAIAAIGDKAKSSALKIDEHDWEFGETALDDLDEIGWKEVTAEEAESYDHFTL